MREIRYSRNIKDDWENPVVKIAVDVDQARARRAGVTSEGIANALNAALAGAEVTGYREGDLTIPVVLRERGAARSNIDLLRTLNVASVDGNPVPLLQIADFDGVPEFARIQRRDLERVISISGVNATKSAAAFDKELAPALAAIEESLPPGYRIEKGGELEDSSKAQGSLTANFPLAFALIILVLVAQFNSIVRPLIIILTIPLVMIGVSLTLNLAPGANFGFMAMLGLLSLAGIIINNAIVLIDKIELERERAATVAEAILNASVARLRPILMATTTTALGLMPIILSRDVLFYDLALVMAGGMVVGTALTLGVVPALYAIFYGAEKPARA